MAVPQTVICGTRFECDRIACHNQKDKTQLMRLDLALDDRRATLRPMLIGYARVSTPEQKLDLQIDALKAAGCERWFSDVASGSKDERPGLEQALEALKPGDTLVVWKLDRLGRSLQHLVKTVGDLGARGVDFRAVQEAIDTTTPGGRLVFHVFAALAEFEREIIQERTRAGLDAARARGRKGGRSRILSSEQIEIAAKLAAEHVPIDKICELLKISRRSYFRYMEQSAKESDA